MRLLTVWFMCLGIALGGIIDEGVEMTSERYLMLGVLAPLVAGYTVYIIVSRVNACQNNTVK